MVLLSPRNYLLLVKTALPHPGKHLYSVSPWEGGNKSSDMLRSVEQPPQCGVGEGTKALIFTFTDLWGGNNLTLGALKLPVVYLPGQKILKTTDGFLPVVQSRSLQASFPSRGTPAGEVVCSTALEGNDASTMLRLGWGEGLRPRVGHVLQRWSQAQTVAPEHTKGKSSQSSDQGCRNGRTQ